MLKIYSGLPLLLFLFAIIALPAFSSDKVRFYDWKSGVVSRGINKKGCYIQFSGMSHENVFITVHLSMIEERSFSQRARAFTLIRITADQVSSIDILERLPIEIQNAWIETVSETSIGNIEDVGSDQSPYFLGRKMGLRLFQNLLAGIEKEGMTVGYQRKTGQEDPTVGKVKLRVPVPPSEVTEKLKVCLDKVV